MSKSFAFGRTGPSKPHLTRGSGGVAGEVSELRRDVEEGFQAVEDSAAIVEHFGGVAIPVTLGDADGIMSAVAGTTGPVDYTASNFGGILAPGSNDAFIYPPKRVTIVATGAATQFLGGVFTIEGEDVDGNFISEALTTLAGAGTTTTTAYFGRVSKVSRPAQTASATIGIGVAADAACIANITSSSSAQRIDSPTEFNMGRVGSRPMPQARQLSFVFSNSADWDASTITIRGLDALGAPLTAQLTVPNGGNQTVTTAAAFSQVLSIDVPAQSGAGGTCTVGFVNTTIGLRKAPILGTITVSGLRELTRASYAGTWAAVGTAGAFSLASAAPPYGIYTPHSSATPDGAREACVVYIPE